MKSDDITRSVRATKNDRTAGDAPSMGKVARMPGTGLPKGERRKRHRSEGGRGSRVRESRRIVILTWSLLLGLTVLVVLGLTVWLWLIPQMRRKNDAGTTLPVVKSERAISVASKFPSPSEAEALAMVKAALAVREISKVPRYFRLGEKTTPQAVVEFLSGLERTDGAFEESHWLSSIDANDLALDGVMVSFKGIEMPRKRLALLTPDATGKWRVDFDAFARTVSPAWSEICASKAPAVSMVRVYVAKDSYYNGPFIDDSQWRCCGLASPDTDEVLLGYLKVGSPQATALEQLFRRDQPMLRATLEIRRVESAERRQFEITRVLAEDWALGPAPFDERFR